jgi:hypothetical protein
MRYCSRCGEQIRGENCESCGAGTAVRTDGGQGPNDRRQGQDDGGNQQPPQGGGQGQPPQGGGQGRQPQGGGQGRQPQGGGQGQPPQGGQGQQRGQQPRGQQPQGQQRGGNQRRGAPPQDDGFSRRQLLIGGGGAVAVLGGGWFFFLRDDGSATSSPDSAAKGYVNALIDGDSERAQELTHAESPLGQSTPDTTTFQAFQQADADISVDASTVDEDIGLNADNFDSVEEFQAVEITLSAQGEEGTLSAVTAQNTDGEWKMWSLGFF